MPNSHSRIVDYRFTAPRDRINPDSLPEFFGIAIRCLEEVIEEEDAAADWETLTVEQRLPLTAVIGQVEPTFTVIRAAVKVME